MHSFNSIEVLVNYDFTQMRALHNRASDAALMFFHQNLANFFNQFGDTRPSLQELQTYVALMQQITENINIAERAYFTEKYTREMPDEAPEVLESCVEHNLLESYESIPSRLQFWAAGEHFGDTIRFAEEHLETVRGLDRWYRMANP